jgi:hypothetical protein
MDHFSKFSWAFLLKNKSTKPDNIYCYHYDILNAVSSLRFKHFFAGNLAVVLSPSATVSLKFIILYLSQQIFNITEGLCYYAITWKQPLNFEKTYWTLFHQQMSPTIPVI